MSHGRSAHLIPRASAALLTLSCLATVLLVPTSASASAYPAPPTGVRVSAATSTSLTVSANASKNAQGYRLFVSTNRTDLYYANLVAGVTTSARRSATSATPKVTVSGLTYTASSYYYRLEAVNGSSYSFNATIGEVGLRPAVPAGLAVHSSTGGTYLTWNSGATTGFSVAMATNSAMTANRRDFSLSGPVHQFTPYGLTKGVKYYFRVRAMTRYTPSAYSGLVSVATKSTEQNVSVMSYNIATLNNDGIREPGGVIAPWAQRRAPAAALIKKWHPDVLAVQEGYALIPGYYYKRQVDSLNDQLRATGVTYTVAKTENYIYGQPGYVRTGDYVLYNPAVYAPYGAGGHWALGGGEYGAFQELKNIRSGAKFLFVSAHLTPGASASANAARQSETKSLMSQASAKAGAAKVPVVYAGDFNSDQTLTSADTPSLVMAGGRVTDAKSVAQAYSNSQYDTYNNYMRTPPAYDLAIDKIFTSVGVAAYSWRVILNLSGGKYVGTIPSDHNPIYSMVVFSH